jgi:chromosome segregation protein
MVYIKKLVMKGFKSFVRKTEILFSKDISVILGANGSGKSNISDALCFVLGRLSIKSMRAAKAKNLIFLGTKNISASKEAKVEMVFDNSDRGFSINENEVSIKRIVRKNGQSIYKINNKTRTRQDVLSLLAQAGIDPNGFNIILQGEIQNFVRMHPEQRRKIIEEVSGIAIYELRKEKSLKELNKTEERLKEITAVLKERTSYLNNLEKERQQALRYKKLEGDIQKYRASIIYSDLSKKKKNKELIETEINKKFKEIEKVKKSVNNIKNKISEFESNISLINETIKKSTGVEQEQLNSEIANLRAELAGLSVKQENSEKKLFSLEKQKKEFDEKIKESEISIKELQGETPKISQKTKELEIKKSELEKLESLRKKFYTTKSELKSIIERIEDKKSVLMNYKRESEFLLKEIEAIDFFDKNTRNELVLSLKNSLKEKRDLLKEVLLKQIELEKNIHLKEHEIMRNNNLISKISKIDICPMCKSKITKEHVGSIHGEAKPKVESLKREVESSNKEIEDIKKNQEGLRDEIKKTESEILKREDDLIKLSNVLDKKDKIKVLQGKIDFINDELSILEKKKINLEKSFDENSNIEQKYETARVEVQEIYLRSEENINSDILFKQKEFDRMKISLRQILREEKDFREELSKVKEDINKKQSLLKSKRDDEEKLSNKFKKLISQRDDFSNKIRDSEIEMSNEQNKIHSFEQEINNFKIDKARIDAEVENFEIEMLEFGEIEIIKSKKEILVEKLNRANDMISRIGSVNMRSLEVYDSIKTEYDEISNKVEIIRKEKDGILKIIHEIDIRKKKAFFKTLNELNETFSRNFAQISEKGVVSLELENKKSPFEGGVGIIVKTGHGKYFDVTSLSGGEQTMVALSLIFAIQELEPYCFYVLDEIDAALDKRNSARLADLLKKYMKKGQYIVITHNDEVITNASYLYGVSMHEGISKVISLKV